MSQLHPCPKWEALPENFPHRVTKPKYALGDCVAWRPLPNIDFGTVRGIEYAPAEHLQAWSWRYIVHLDPSSPSYAWISTDTAWQDDLELITPNDSVH